LEENSKISSHIFGTISRRGFVKSIIGIWTGVLSLPFVYAAVNYVIPPKKRFLSHEIRNNPELLTTRIPIENLAQNSSLFVNVEGETVLVIRKEGLEIAAFSAICTHLNCIIGYRKNQKDIYCNCHESSFTLEGNPLNGPARLPLKKYHVEIENNVIKVKNI